MATMTMETQVSNKPWAVSAKKALSEVRYVGDNVLPLLRDNLNTDYYTHLVRDLEKAEAEKKRLEKEFKLAASHNLWHRFYRRLKSLFGYEQFSSEHWRIAVTWWGDVVHVRKMAIYRFEFFMRAKIGKEFGISDLDILNDPERNTQLNYVHKAAKMVDAFYKQHPDIDRPGNYFKKTYLFGADLDCDHKENKRSFSGVSCIECGGWFCY